MTVPLPEKFETAEEADNNTTRLATQLKKSSKPEAQLLALKLEACLAGDGPPCRSGACARCSREIRIEFLNEIEPYCRIASERHKMTLVLGKCAVPAGELQTLDMAEVKGRYERLLRRILPKNLIVIGGIDVSVNSFDNVNFIWSVHIDVIVLKIGPGPSIDDYKVVLRKKLPDDDIHRPLRVRRVNPETKWSGYTYCLKAKFEWRSGYVKSKGLRKRNPHRATRGIDLKPKHEVELRLWLAQGTMVNRLILVGVANPASPKSIKLRDTSRTPKQSEKDTCPARGKSRVTRSRSAKKRSAHRRVKRGAR